jgi:hypothetical protein
MSVDGKVWLWKILGGCGVMLLQICFKDLSLIIYWGIWLAKNMAIFQDKSSISELIIE